MPDSNRNHVKAQETILELLKQIQTWRPSKLTREDINYLRGRLDLLEYLITPKPDGAIKPVKRVSLLPCKVCGPQPLPVTVYKYQDEWYCGLHLPATVTYPIGMHGDEFEAYQERKK